MISENKEEKRNAALSKKFIERSRIPEHAGTIPDADAFAKITGPCGDTIEMWLKAKKSKDNIIEDDIVQKITFLTDGCGFTIACADIAAEMITDKKIIEAQKISQKIIIDALGGLPDDHKHCALLASNTLKKIIEEYISLKKT